MNLQPGFVVMLGYHFQLIQRRRTLNQDSMLTEDGLGLPEVHAPIAQAGVIVACLAAPQERTARAAEN